MEKRIIRCLCAACALLAFIVAGGCGERGFKVKGEIEGAPDSSVVVEKSDFRGRWQPIDSTRTSPGGKFSISLPSPAAPEVYRLGIGGEYVYFPVDSTETINVRGRKPGLATNYTLEGSEQAGKMAEFDHALSAAAAKGGDMSDFKRQVYDKYIRDSRGSLLSFYVLTKTVGDRPLFDPADHTDIKYYTAVATAFKEFKPADPRTQYLEQTAIRALRERNSAQGKKQVLQADKELTAIDITLPDRNGKSRSLSELLGNGRRTLVVFSVLTHPDAPLINKAVARCHAAGMNVYQVSLDNDQYGWREAAENLPWVNVLDPEADRSSNALKYNVSKIPVFFLYNERGELIDRADDLDALAKMVR